MSTSKTPSVNNPTRHVAAFTFCIVSTLLTGIAHAQSLKEQADRRFNQARRSVKMVESRNGLWRRKGAMLAAAGLLALSGAALATNQSQQRQQGRNANQAAKQEARAGKVDYRAANQKSNSQCRQEKRDTKQEGLQQKRDIKY